MSLKAQVMAEIAGDPHRTGRAIAEAAGCALSYVYTVARREGLAFGRSRAAARREIVAFLGAENFDWAVGAAVESGVSVSDLVNGLVTDARMEEEGIR